MGRSASHAELHSPGSYRSQSRSARPVAKTTGGTARRGVTIADFVVRQVAVERMGRLVRTTRVPTETCSLDQETAVDDL